MKAADKQAEAGPVTGTAAPTIVIKKLEPVRLRLSLCLSVIAFWVVATAWLMGGGIKHPELDGRIPFQLSPAPLMAKLFDSREYDGDTYQARELSYLCDHVDCKFISWSVHAGFPHLLSITMLLFTAMLVLVVWRFCMRDLRLGAVTTLALTLLFLTAPVNMLSSSFFRTSKIGASLMTVLCMMLLFRFDRFEQPRTFRYVAGTCLQIFGLASVAMLFDRQAVFLSCVAICCVVLLAVRRAGGCRWLMPVPFIAALGLNEFYNQVVGPHLTWAYNGYWASFEFQTMPWNDFVANIQKYLSDGFSLTVGTVGFFLGNLPSACIILCWVGVGWLLWRGERQTHMQVSSFRMTIGRCVPLCLAAGIVVSITVMNALMVCRHSAVLWADVRRTYYWLPVTAIWFVLLAIILRELQQLVGMSRLRMFQAGIFVLVVSNVVALPHHLAVLRAGHLGPDMPWASLFSTAMRHPSSATESTPPAVTRNAIYQLFKYGHNRYAAPALPMGVFEGKTWRVEVLSFSTNRLQYAFAAVDNEPCAARGAVVTASASPVLRSGLLGPMRITASDGRSYRFSPRPLRLARGVVHHFRIRIVNKTVSQQAYRLGALIEKSNGQPLKLLAVGVDKWLFSKEQEADFLGARDCPIAIAGGASKEFVYAFACDDARPSIELQLND